MPTKTIYGALVAAALAARQAISSALTDSAEEDRLYQLGMQLDLDGIEPRTEEERRAREVYERRLV